MLLKNCKFSFHFEVHCLCSLSSYIDQVHGYLLRQHGTPKVFSVTRMEASPSCGDYFFKCLQGEVAGVTGVLNDNCQSKDVIKIPIMKIL